MRALVMEVTFLARMEKLGNLIQEKAFGVEKRNELNSEIMKITIEKKKGLFNLKLRWILQFHLNIYSFLYQLHGIPFHFQIH